MSARDEILRHPGVLATADAEIGALLDKHRAEVLREAGGLADQLIADLQANHRTEPDAFARVDAIRGYSDRLHEVADEAEEKTTATLPEPLCRCGHAERSHRRLTTWGGTGCLACTGPIGWLHDFTAEEKTTASATAVTPQPDTPALALPQLAVPCPSCDSPAGQLCTSHGGTRVRRRDTHQARTRSHNSQKDEDR